ncbi:MAG TPA: T9SS type A sorting domain-containing protein [Bacteroidia bacterium]|jgi:hypothetical protein|nr:T9SS type A sorting domain-containing protein [Bacteroidia bacterium]
MKKLLCFIFLVCITQLNAQVTSELPIAPRIQWPNNNGYCGENSIQACGLYYGNYISEGLCRTVAGGELLLYVNDTTALEAFSFTYKEWNPNATTPQYNTYLNWVKQYLYKKQPVIIAVYVSGMTDPDYDHIIPAIGFKATSVNAYTTTDSLTYNSNFDTTPFTRIFSTLYATRAQAGNSALYPYYIPKDVNYGVAVTGNKDPNHLTKPVHIDLDSNDEPNISLGANPCILKATITVDSLTAGQPYALLRYNNYQTVPSQSFNPTGASSVVYFTATATTKILADTFMSNTAVFYRCIPYTLSGITNYNTTSSVKIYPNPANNKITVDAKNIDEVTLFDMLGKQITSTKENEIDTSNLPNGVYFIQVKTNTNTSTQKIIVQH